jgi:uncharacterized protein (DUF924 family)
MAGDLGAADVEVHAAQVLDFWFALTMEQQFAKDPALDAAITERFGPLRDTVFAAEAAGWRDTPDTLLAAVILLDQFTRNIHRGTSRAFEADPLALSLTQKALGEEWEDRYPPERRAFLLMPLMHAEDAGLQRLSVERFAALGNPENLRFAQDHAAVVERYGRFPSRNAALGRASSPAEQEYLSRPDAGW